MRASSVQRGGLLLRQTVYLLVTVTPRRAPGVADVLRCGAASTAASGRAIVLRQALHCAGVRSPASAGDSRAPRRGGRVAEGARLLSEYGVYISIESSNLFLSASSERPARAGLSVTREDRRGRRGSGGVGDRREVTQRSCHRGRWPSSPQRSSGRCSLGVWRCRAALRSQKSTRCPNAGGSGVFR